MKAHDDQKAPDDHQYLLALLAAIKNIDSPRLQKLVFLLETAGAPLRYRYQMHFNEPYSEDLEADLNLLTTQGFITQEVESSTGKLVIGSTGAATDPQNISEGLRPYLHAIAELAKVDARILDFATTFGAWRKFKYDSRDAFERAVRNAGDKKIDAEGARFLERLGLLTKS